MTKVGNSFSYVTTQYCFSFFAFSCRVHVKYFHFAFPSVYVTGQGKIFYIFLTANLLKVAAHCSLCISKDEGNTEILDVTEPNILPFPTAHLLKFIQHIL